MLFYEVLLIGVGLSMDAAAVSATNGMCYTSMKKRQMLLMAFAFGLFQGAMPLIGYFAGTLFTEQISNIDHWVAMILLSFIGGKMLIDGFKKDKDKDVKPFSLKLLTLQAIATSIDALAVGVSFAAVDTNIFYAVCVIAVSTFLLSLFAVWLGRKVGDKLNKTAEILGGAILVFIGVKILVEHLIQG